MYVNSFGQINEIRTDKINFFCPYFTSCVLVVVTRLQVQTAGLLIIWLDFTFNFFGQSWNDIRLVAVRVGEPTSSGRVLTSKPPAPPFLILFEGLCVRQWKNARFSGKRKSSAAATGRWQCLLYDGTPGKRKIQLDMGGSTVFELSDNMMYLRLEESPMFH